MHKKLHIVMYHYTRDLANSRYPAIKGMDIHLFKQQMDFFAQNFSAVTMEDVIEAYEAGKEMPDNALLLTFDDGYIDNYTVALPILKEHHMQGSFFIPGKTIAENVLLDVNKIHFIMASASAAVLLPEIMEKLDHYRGEEFRYPSNEELFLQYAKANRWDSRETIFIKRILQTGVPEQVRNRISSELFAEHVGIAEDKFARELYMNRDQIRFMKNEGMFIGIHGYDHYHLGNLEKAEVNKDLEKALAVMDEFIDRKHWVMNYPYGSHTEETTECVSKMGAVLGITVEPGVAEIREEDRYELPRFDCNDFPPKSEKWREIENE